MHIRTSAPSVAAKVTAGLVGATLVLGPWTTSATGAPAAGPAKGSALAAAGGPASAAPRSTEFAFGAMGYASRVQGGRVPTRSDRLAYAVIGCTNRAGLTSTNHQAQVRLRNGLLLDGLRTRVTTRQVNGVTTSRAFHRIAQVTLLDLAVSRLTLEGVTSTSTAFHNRTGFHARTTTNIADITLRTPGRVQHFRAPAPGRTLIIPGVARISLGEGKRAAGPNGARASADAVSVTVLPTQTKAKLAHSAATLSGGITGGLFSGSIWSTRAQAVNGVVNTGRTAIAFVPCPGTDGKLRVRGASITRIGSDDVVASVLRNSQRTNQIGNRAFGFTQASIAKVRLSNLRISGIVARANVNREGRQLTASSKGTRIAKVTFFGRELNFGPRGRIFIPGVARLEQRVVTRSVNGIGVTALKITLLNSERIATVELGYAALRIKRA